ncbi:MAG: class I SAM-dependent methyltransferase [Chloroflexi bacterium]|nr:class I SAM-dependent methyltransferase [Chloroflexota bacterium]
MTANSGVSCSFMLACPTDRARLEIEGDAARCPICGCVYARTNQIWRFVDHRLAPYENFLATYRVVRRAEGWGSHDAAYYCNLPQTSRDDPQAAIWRVRAASFKKLVALVEPGARLLDVGAGNGWLSYQFARRGHAVAALDLNDDAREGLGAQNFYPLPLDCYQADFDHLPFDAAQFDVVIFNASLHYSRNLTQTLNEAWRVLKPNDKLIVMDSPLYRQRASGKAMLREKANEFQSRYGLEMDRTMRGFLTFDDFQQSVCAWQWYPTRVDWRWALRPLRARALGQREPAQFGVTVGKPPAARWT